MDDIILLAHGSGGIHYRKLIEQVIAPALSSSMLDIDNDSAIMPPLNGHLAMTTDSFVIKPLFFPGGDIGRLAVCGTVNDLAVAGAKPLYLTSSFIIEAGFSIEALRNICISMSKAAIESDIKIVTGDTKVVPKGACDGIFINTAGVGEVNTQLLPKRKPQQGDLVLFSGNIGEHEAVIAALRDGSIKSFPLKSDVAPLNNLTAALYNNCEVLAMRDATRGGVAAVLNEFAEKFNIGIELEESKLPISKTVAAICEIFGFEPLHMANEGKLVALIPAAYAKKAIEILHKHVLGINACIVGTVFETGKPVTVLHTDSGGKRIVLTPSGELLPRIC